VEITAVPYDGPVGQALVAALTVDINERYAFEIEAWSPQEKAQDEVAYEAEVDADLVVAPHGAFYVAWLDGEPAGCGALKPLHRDGAEPTAGEIKRMYTAPHARRRGVSRALLARLEARAVELGYRRLQLETGTAQPEALALYADAGWHRIAPYGRYKDTADSICFAKDLGPPADPVRL
jgi:GNAT superfamily N-acetyltransferase